MKGVWTDPQDNVVIGSSIYPDGHEKVSMIRYTVQSFMPMPTDKDPSPRNGVTKLMEAFLHQRLGPSTRQSDECGNRTVIYGSGPHLEDGGAFLTYPVCMMVSSSTTVPSFKCDRRRAIRRPWLGLFGDPRSFQFRIEDGEIAYSNRYSPGFVESRPNYEY